MHRYPAKPPGRKTKISVKLRSIRVIVIPHTKHARLRKLHTVLMTGGRGPGMRETPCYISTLLTSVTSVFRDEKEGHCRVAGSLPRESKIPNPLNQSISSSQLWCNGDTSATACPTIDHGHFFGGGLVGFFRKFNF